MRHVIMLVVAGLGIAVSPGRAYGQLDLYNIAIGVIEAQPTNAFTFCLDAEGAWIADVFVTPPVGSAADLDCAYGLWDNSTYCETFASLALLEARFPTGQYLFEFNAATRSISLAHGAFNPPTEFADIDYSPKLGGDST